MVVVRVRRPTPEILGLERGSTHFLKEPTEGMRCLHLPPEELLEHPGGTVWQLEKEVSLELLWRYLVKDWICLFDKEMLIKFCQKYLNLS